MHLPTHRLDVFAYAAARRERDLAPLDGDPRWQALPASPGTAPWRDDFSNLAGVIRW